MTFLYTAGEVVVRILEHPELSYDDLKNMVSDFSKGNDYAAGVNLGNFISILMGENLGGSINNNEESSSSSSDS